MKLEHVGLHCIDDGIQKSVIGIDGDRDSLRPAARRCA
jgi:hypothetical protein